MTLGGSLFGGSCVGSFFGGSCFGGGCFGGGSAFGLVRSVLGGSFIGSGGSTGCGGFSEPFFLSPSVGRSLPGLSVSPGEPVSALSLPWARGFSPSLFGGVRLN